MPMIFGNRLLERFVELASEAKQVDIAVAWASPCDPIDALEASGADIRAVVGTSGNSTIPSTLRRLAEFSALRIPAGNTHQIFHPMFHPKYYCFHGETTICWIGSANLTGGGFGTNVELMHEFELQKPDDLEWFEQLWEDLDPDPWPAIREYEKRYKPPKHTPRPAPAKRDTALPLLAEIETWRDFVEGLCAYDEFYRYHESGFDVVGKRHSWLHTIMTGHEVVLLNDWANLTRRECHILRGLTTQDDDEGGWALLGTVGFQANYVFNNDHMPEVGSDRQEIRALIEPVLFAADNVADVAHAAVQEIRAMRRIKGERPGVGHAAATRWLALARPDCLVSVNNASARRLSEALGIPQRSSDGLANVYGELIARLHNRPWFNEFNGGQPANPLDRVIWNRRAALVDVFVYDHKLIRGTAAP